MGDDWKAIADKVAPEARPLLEAAKAVQERRRCTCELRQARWNPITHMCGACKGIAWPVFDRMESDHG